MSKKLIAVAAAAALALTGLVSTPANASITVVFANAGGTTITPSATSAAAAANVDVPSNNTIEYTATSARNSAMKVTVTTVSGDAVSATSTGGIKVLESLTDATSASGSTTYTKTATTTSVEFYAFTTSTSAGSLTVSVGGNSRVVYFKGNAGPAYNIAVTAPTTVGATAPSKNNLKVAVTDVFGNAIATGTPITVDVLGSGSFITAAGTITATPAYDATDKLFGAKLGAATAGSFGLSVKITSAPTDVTGLAEAKDTFYTTVNSADLETQVTSLTAQVNTLKADYNKLAARWNKLVASKKAPKKTVATK
jgi:hypothetical protein